MTPSVMLELFLSRLYLICDFFIFDNIILDFIIFEFSLFKSKIPHSNSVLCRIKKTCQNKEHLVILRDSYPLEDKLLRISRDAKTLHSVRDLRFFSDKTFVKT